MDNRDLLLSIDNGTQSLKAMIFDPRGNLMAKEQVVFNSYTSGRPGWAEQDPDLYWKALCKACRRLLENSGISKERIAGAALTAQRGTVVNVDEQGRPLRPAILWLDQRKARGMKPVGGLWGALFRTVRLRDTVAYLQAEAEANWIKTHQPDIWERTHKYLLLSGYLTYRLVGRFVDSVGCQVGYLPFDYKHLRWAPGWSWKWRCIPVTLEQLPDLVPPGGVLGTVTPGASLETGIPEGLPLIAAAADKACEVVGSGGVEPSVGCLSYGTTATINVTHDKYIEPIRLLPAYPSAVKDSYTMEVQVYRGYWMVNWFKEEFGHFEQMEASRRGVTAEEVFEHMLDKIPPCSMGLMLQPFWTPGLKSPGPEAKGAIIGFGDVHTRAHLYRSILEGLAYALREGRERIEQRSRVPITALRVSGGGSQSDNAIQLTADVFGIPAARPHVYETSGLGAAVDTAVGLGFYSSFRSAVQEMTRLRDVFDPDLSSHRLYDALYREVYRKMYKRLKPLYEKIRDITGYPEQDKP